MLSSDMREGAERRLVIRNADIETLRAFLEYIYTGSLPEVAVGNAPRLQELIPLGDLYGMPELVTDCAQKLTGLLSAANVGVVFRALRAYRHFPAVEACMSRAKTQLKASDDMLEALLASLCVNCPH
ncbi:unnamed protein product [Polarella glacialis]|uniref:BTB domain-containing protein n=1 Tax=Polarella glacialis TaxID=89957 RepID=A0A813FHC7_POLGL|nr:unnamed protein product [Polarella glacialis]